MVAGLDDLRPQLEHVRTVSLLMVMALAGCDSAAGHATPAARTTANSDAIARARQDSVNRAQPGYVVDSLLPFEEEVRRFIVTVGGTVATELTGGAPSRDSLLHLFTSALERRDTAALVRALVTPREFIDLYYPGSPFSRPPYRQPPGFMWSQLSLGSSKGLSRLLERHGGLPSRVVGVECGNTVVREAIRILNGCRIRFAGSTRTERLFGSIIARNGVYKFLSYSNQY